MNKSNKGIQWEESGEFELRPKSWGMRQVSIRMYIRNEYIDGGAWMDGWVDEWLYG